MSVRYYKKRSLYRLNIYHIVSYRHIYHIGILSFCSYWFAALHNFFSMHLETDYLVNCCYYCCCCASLYTKNKSRQVYINQNTICMVFCCCCWSCCYGVIIESLRASSLRLSRNAQSSYLSVSQDPRLDAFSMFDFNFDFLFYFFLLKTTKNAKIKFQFNFK